MPSPAADVACETDDEADDPVLLEALADQAQAARLRETSPAPAPTPKGAGQREKIILVDDDRDFLDLSERMLSKEGYSAICTDSPRTVAHLTRTVQPCAVIVDILMPGFNGWDVLRELKASQATANVSVIMTSILDDKKAAIANGADGFIEKPFTVEKLRTALAETQRRTVTRAA